MAQENNGLPARASRSKFNKFLKDNVMVTTSDDAPQSEASTVATRDLDATRAALHAAVAAAVGGGARVKITVELAPASPSSGRGASPLTAVPTFRPGTKKSLLVDCVAIFARRGQHVTHYGRERGIAGRREHLPEPLRSVSSMQLEKTVEHAIRDGRLIKVGDGSFLDVPGSVPPPWDTALPVSEWRPITTRDVAVFRAERAAEEAARLATVEAGR